MIMIVDNNNPPTPPLESSDDGLLIIFRRSFPTLSRPFESKCVKGSSNTRSEEHSRPRRATKSEKPRLRDKEHRRHCPLKQ